MLGTAGQLVTASLRSANYTIGAGILNSEPPARPNLSAAHAFPNPYKAPIHQNKITFTKLTYRATIRIYTISGELVRTLYKNDNRESLEWKNVRGEHGQKLASGLYFYFIKSENSIKKGKLVIIQ